MVELKTISMTRCPYCGEEWVREDTELVCTNCVPALSIDLAIADIVSSVDALKSAPLDKVKDRLDLLVSTHQAMGEIIKKMKPRS